MSLPTDMELTDTGCDVKLVLRVLNIRGVKIVKFQFESNSNRIVLNNGQKIECQFEW